MAAYWIPTNSTPSFKLNVGYSESGKILTRSVSIRNIDANTLTNAQKKAALENIITNFVNGNYFEYSIYKVEVTGKYSIEVD